MAGGQAERVGVSSFARSTVPPYAVQRRGGQAAMLRWTGFEERGGRLWFQPPVEEDVDGGRRRRTTFAHGRASSVPRHANGPARGLVLALSVQPQPSR